MNVLKMYTIVTRTTWTALTKMVVLNVNAIQDTCSSGGIVSVTEMWSCNLFGLNLNT